MTENARERLKMLITLSGMPREECHERNASMMACLKNW